MESIGLFERIKNNIRKTVIGKDDVIELMLVCLSCGGHILLEDVPGLGKTTVAAALASSVGCNFKRIQFTPDVLPSDITGYNLINLTSGKREFHEGVLQNQIILADEINRASPKTQSAMLEAMQERQITVDGQTYKLPTPFMVIATQNPIDMAGTYPLPEAQLDRFLMRIKMGYPSKESEKEILSRHRSVVEKPTASPVCSAEEILEIQSLVDKVAVVREVADYIVEIIRATRTHDGVMLGCSPRASIALMQASCGYAVLKGRDYVTPDDVRYLAPFVLSHRIITRNSLSSSNPADIIGEVISSIKVPKF